MSNPLFVPGVVTVLAGHRDAASAKFVEDYPYGWSKRCRIRYWIESKDGFGTRCVSQTTNPDREGKVGSALADGGHVWNKPKASTYAPCTALYVDEKGHTRFAQLKRHSAEHMRAFLDQFEAGLTPAEIRWLTRRAEKADRREADRAARGGRMIPANG
jgi:hypothetical protein